MMPLQLSLTSYSRFLVAFPFFFAVIVDAVNGFFLFGVGCFQLLFHCPQFGCQLGIVVQLLGKTIAVAIVVSVVFAGILVLVFVVRVCRLRFGQIVQESHAGGRFLQCSLFFLSFLLPPQLLFRHFPAFPAGVLAAIQLVVVVGLPRDHVFGKFSLLLFLGGDFLDQDHVLQHNIRVQDLFQSHNTRRAHKGGTLFCGSRLVNRRVQAGRRRDQIVAQNHIPGLYQVAQVRDAGQNLVVGAQIRLPGQLNIGQGVLFDTTRGSLVQRIVVVVSRVFVVAVTAQFHVQHHKGHQPLGRLQYGVATLVIGTRGSTAATVFVVGFGRNLCRVDLVCGRPFRRRIDEMHHARHLGDQGQATTQQVSRFFLYQDQIVATEWNHVAGQRVFDVGGVVFGIRGHQLLRGLDLDRRQPRQKVGKMLRLR
mmetsp:Transcript_20182/g.56095  ORF Transcript_20182/g.56095 Transcript_20182/m.56095 type:complete len:421 (+) Transcript_20182:575-1837(+)